MTARVSAGGRLHFGFLNLSLAHERLYGGVGVAIDALETVVRAEPAEGVYAPDGPAVRAARRSVDLLDVPGAAVTIEAELPRHAGLGSGTQLALAVHAAIARCHGRDPAVRRAAPTLDRGGRSGVGVAAFERGGFVVDAGHPTDRFTTERPARGEWTVPPVMVRHDVPSSWRFVVLVPNLEPGPAGDREDRRMRSAVEGADPSLTKTIAILVTQRLLPAIADGDRAAFGGAVAELGRLNGVWYADEQGGVHRPPIGTIVDALAESPAVAGAGQSSWGPTVYAVTDVDRADAAVAAATDALETAGVDGVVHLVAGRNRGATVEPIDEP